MHLVLSKVENKNEIFLEYTGRPVDKWPHEKLIFDYLNQDICNIRSSFGKMTMCTFLFNHDMGKKTRNKKNFNMLKKKFKNVLLDFW